MSCEEFTYAITIIFVLFIAAVIWIARDAARLNNHNQPE